MPTTYTPLFSSTLSTAQPSVTFNSIGGSYSDLVLVANAQSAQATTYDNLIIQFNSDTGSNYSRVRLNAFSGGAVSEVGSNSNAFGIGPITGTSYSSAIFSQSTIQIKGYSNTTTYKTAIWRSNSQNDYVQAGVGTWRNTNAINSITIKTASGSNLAAGSTFSLYGIASAAVVSGAKATGGDTIATDGTYWYHAFKASGTFTPIQSLTADVLVVAGGGGGSGNADSGNTAGGGGAGGFLVHTTQTLSTAQTITIGAGGNGGPTVGGGGGSGTGNGSKGSNSQFGSLTASEGGGFGAFIGTGGNGGSGGGGNNGGIGTVGQGNNGAGSVANYQAGGGGGAGSAGNTNGNGGIGSSSYSSWGSATGTGQNVSGTYYFAGGGGGGQYFYTDGSGLGGSGGGGNSGRWNGSIVTAAISGTANTGGGGGGAGSRDGQGAKVGGNGGSGIIIVRYPV